MKKIIILIVFCSLAYTSKSQSYGEAIGLQSTPNYFNPYAYYYYPEPIINIDNTVIVTNPTTSETKKEQNRSVNLIDMSQDQILGYLIGSGISENKIIKGFVENTNDPYIIYEENGISFGYYFNANNICDSYRVMYPENRMNNIVKILNEGYTKTGEYTWESYNNKHTFSIGLNRHIENAFSVDVFIKK